MGLAGRVVSISATNMGTTWLVVPPLGNALPAIIIYGMQSANSGPLREERALIPGGDRPADILLPNHAGGRDEAVDVCIVSTLQTQLIDCAAVEPGFALVHRYRQKISKYQEAC